MAELRHNQRQFINEEKGGTKENDRRHQPLSAESSVSKLKGHEKLEDCRHKHRHNTKEKEKESKENGRRGRAASADRVMSTLQSENEHMKQTNDKDNQKENEILLKARRHKKVDSGRNQERVTKEKPAKSIDRGHQCLSADRDLSKLRGQEKLIKRTTDVYNLEVDPTLVKARRDIIVYLRRNQQRIIKDKERETKLTERRHQSLSADSGVSNVRAEKKLVNDKPIKRRHITDENVTFLKTRQNMTDTAPIAKRILEENGRQLYDKRHQFLSASRTVAQRKTKEKQIDPRSLQHFPVDTSTRPKNKTYILPPVQNQNRMLPQLPSKRFHNYELSEYLQTYYKDSARFINYHLHNFDINSHLTFTLVPTFQIVDCEDKEEKTSEIVKALSIECQHRPKCLNLCGSRSAYRSVLLLTNETAIPGIYFVHIWLQSTQRSAIGYEQLHAHKLTFTVFKGKHDSSKIPEYEHPRTYKQTDNHNFMSQYKGVFLLEIKADDDVSDLKKMLAKSFQMKEKYYLQNVLIIFECKHEDPGSLKELYNTVNMSNLPQITFMIITSINKEKVAALELNAERTLIADGIDSLIVSAIETDTMTNDDVEELTRQVNQLVTKRKTSLWEKYPVQKICLENVKCNVVIRLPDEIQSIQLSDCDPTIHLVHNATVLDISCQSALFYDTFNPLALFASTLTTVTLGFSAKSHIFYGNLYKKLANGLSQNAQIISLFLRNMKVGKQVFTIKLGKQEIEQMKISLKANEDYRRHGSRILGPKQTFDIKDFNAEFEKHDSFGAYVILDLICYDLVKTHDAISECFAAIQTKTETIYLVCFMNRSIDMDTFKGFNVVKRDDCLVSKESLNAENSLDRDEPSLIETANKEFISINETISYHADYLMSEHRNLEAVKVSFVKSSKGQYEHPYPCVVLYCKVKGYIPFGENYFPKQLTHPFLNKSYKTDVREGFFTPCPYLTSPSTEWNNELALGCSIGEINTNVAATLGPFVNIKETNETCFLTAAHIFQPVPPRNNSDIEGVKVVQPANIHFQPSTEVLQDSLCGEVLCSHIGGQCDAALVKIYTERLPSRAQFVNITEEDLNLAGLSHIDLSTYDDGEYTDVKTLTKKYYEYRRIIKIGNATSLTKGTLSTTDGIVRVTMEYTTLETLYNGSRQTNILNNQLLIDSSATKIFCQAGDSGSAVFLVDDDNRLHCIGMVIGMLANDCSTVVTPIKNILDILGHKLDKTLESKRFVQMDEP